MIPWGGPGVAARLTTSCGGIFDNAGTIPKKRL